MDNIDECTILRCLVGSTIHGLALEGTDDRDEMGICIEPKEYVIGLKRFEQYTYRTKPEGVRSEAGDLDLVIYSLRKWMRLALGGNPTVQLLLFSPEFIKSSGYSDELRNNAFRFLSKHTIRAYLGYFTQQKQRLIGERGQMSVKRPELIEAHGYDTKYAMHMLRLGYQGCELANWGHLVLPMDAAQRSYIMGVRKGEVSLNEVLNTAGALQSRLEDYLSADFIPDEPDYEWANQCLIDAYQNYWNNGLNYEY